MNYLEIHRRFMMRKAYNRPSFEEVRDMVEFDSVETMAVACATLDILLAQWDELTDAWKDELRRDKP